MITFFINGKPALNNGPRNVSGNRINLEMWVLDEFILAEEYSQKPYEVLEFVSQLVKIFEKISFISNITSHI